MSRRMWALVAAALAALTVSMGGGESEPASGLSCGRVVTVEVPRSRYPNVVDHIEDTWREGASRLVRLNRKGADERRERLMGWYTARHPQPVGDEYDLDERPAAFLRSTWRADVRKVWARENRSEGASVGNQLRGVPDGTCVRYDFRG